LSVLSNEELSKLTIIKKIKLFDPDQVISTSIFVPGKILDVMKIIIHIIEQLFSASEANIVLSEENYSLTCKIQKLNVKAFYNIDKDEPVFFPTKF